MNESLIEQNEISKRLEEPSGRSCRTQPKLAPTAERVDVAPIVNELKATIEEFCTLSRDNEMSLTHNAHLVPIFELLCTHLTILATKTGRERSVPLYQIDHRIKEHHAKRPEKAAPSPGVTKAIVSRLHAKATEAQNNPIDEKERSTPSTKCLERLWSQVKAYCDVSERFKTMTDPDKEVALSLSSWLEQTLFRWRRDGIA